MSKLTEFIKQPRTHDELHEMTDYLTGLKGRKTSTISEEDNERWSLVYEYLDFHANGTPTTKAES